MLVDFRKLIATMQAYSIRMRIVSLLPSTTEIVFDLGLENDLLGVTFECNFPPRARVGREIVVGGMDTKHLQPDEIDALVRSRLAAGDELYTLDEAALARCDPDLILSQDLCRVCAVPSGNVDEAVERLGCRAQVLQIDPQTLDEVIDSVLTIADAAGVPERGRELVASLRVRLETVEKVVASLPSDVPRPTVFVLEWVDPPFLGGHWVPDLVRAAGGEPVLSRAGDKSIPTTWEDIAAADPDHIVVAPCGYDLEGAMVQAQMVLDRMPTRAAVWAIDADAVVVRPGPRLVDGVEALASAILPPSTGFALPDSLIRRLR
jgi:iron complex transport system substrate-binding protein